MRLNSTLVLLLAAALPASLARSESQMDEKLRLEQAMTQQVSSILDQFLGPGKSHVTVTLGVEVKQMDSARGPADKKAPPPNAPANKKNSPTVQMKWLWQDVRKKRMTVLPGFSIAPEVTLGDERKNEPKPKEAKEEKKDEPPEPEGAVYMMEVNRILVTVVLDKSTPPKIVEVVKSMVSEVLALDPDRGDKLTVYTVPLLPSWQRMLYSSDSLGNIGRILLWVLVGALSLWLLTKAVAAILRSFGLLPEKKPVPAAGKGEAAAKGKDAADKTKNPAGKAAPDKPEGDAAKAPAPMPKYFDFINKDNAALLAELLINCEPQAAANVVGFLEPSVAALVLNHLKPENRLSILWCLSWAKSLPSESHESIRAMWKERIEHAFGGTDSVGDLLSDMDVQHQTAFINKMAETSPDLAGKIKRNVLRFENLFLIEDKDLALLAQTFSFQDWAVALSGLPADYAQRLLNVLPQASKPALQQWLSLTPANAPAAPQTRTKITKLARTMSLEGRISLQPAATDGADKAAKKPEQPFSVTMPGT